MCINYKEKWEEDFERWLVKEKYESVFSLLEGKNIYLYGAGHIGKCVVDMLEENGIEITGIIDSDKNKWETYVYSRYQCQPFESVEIHNDVVILVTSNNGYKEIFEKYRKFSKNMINPGITMSSKIPFIISNFYKADEEKCRVIKGRISSVFDMLADDESKKVYYYVCKSVLLSKVGKTLYEEAQTELPEYFFDEFMKSKPCDKFVDCGAFDGDTFELYYNYMDGKFDTAFLYEMDKNTYELLKDNINKKYKDIKKRIECINAGVADETATVMTSIVADNGMWKIDESGNKEAKLVKLDESIVGKVNLIKMDIEGAELSAIKGAENIIRNQKPNLAICIYHKPDDLWEIPTLIKKFNPNYELYIKHHSFYCQDTILYAIDKKA